MSDRDDFSTRSEVDTLRGMLMQVATNQATLQGQLSAMLEDARRLRTSVETLVSNQAAQTAKVEAFWETGKGAQWEHDISSNTAALNSLREEISNIKTEAKVSKAKQVGVLTGVGIAGGTVGTGLIQLLRQLTE